MLSVFFLLSTVVFSLVRETPSAILSLAEVFGQLSAFQLLSYFLQLNGKVFSCTSII